MEKLHRKLRAQNLEQIKVRTQHPLQNFTFQTRNNYELLFFTFLNAKQGIQSKHLLRYCIVYLLQNKCLSNLCINCVYALTKLAIESKHLQAKCQAPHFMTRVQ